MDLIEEIVAMAVLLGKTEESEALRALCQAAEGELTGWLRDGVTAEDCGQCFVLAGAWLALAAREVAEDDGVEAFTAGDVTVRQGDREIRGRALRLQARQVMRPYLQDEGFSFQGVRG